MEIKKKEEFNLELKKRFLKIEAIFFFSYSLKIHVTAGEGRAIFTSLYHFHKVKT